GSGADTVILVDTKGFSSLFTTIKEAKSDDLMILLMSVIAREAHGYTQSKYLPPSLSSYVKLKDKIDAQLASLEENTALRPEEIDQLMAEQLGGEIHETIMQIKFIEWAAANGYLDVQRCDKALPRLGQESAHISFA